MENRKVVRFVFTCILLSSIGMDGLNAATIRIAWMAPAKYYYYFNASTSMGALVYAIETIKNDSSLLPGYDFE